ncbi:hypothetical protein CBA19CS91_33750 [Paraburkholderia hospita]|nr:hypothetical protein CBA19CS91_33750 [Paraburkholderia hospita]
MEHALLDSHVERADASDDMRLYFLDHGGNRVLSAMSDGSGFEVLVDDCCAGPDGIAIDTARGHLYWTNMGVPSRNDGFIMRCDLDGGDLTTIVPPGLTHTPKQLLIEPRGGHLSQHRVCERSGRHDPSRFAGRLRYARRAARRRQSDGHRRGLKVSMRRHETSVASCAASRLLRSSLRKSTNVRIFAST